MQTSWLASKYSTTLTILPVVAFAGVAFANGDECGGLFQSVKPAGRVVLTVLDQKMNGFGENTNDAFRIPLVKIHAGNQEIQLRNLEPLAIADDARVYIFARGADGNRRSLAVPIWIGERLRDYLRQGGPPMAPFDCNCFAHWVNGIPFQFGEFKSRSWNFESVFDEAVVKPGDTILLGYGFEEVNHIAVSLGEGLYISKFGVAGPVLITNFATLQLVYGGFLIARATPKKEDANPTPVP